MIFNFGIFQDALQSGIVEVMDFPQKFFHSFQWGLQNLRYIIIKAKHFSFVSVLRW